MQTKGGEIMRKNLKIFRVENNLSQNGIANKLGYERAYFGHIERGFMDGSSKFWARLQKAFSLSDEKVEELKVNE